jgi:hypothetical protein
MALVAQARQSLILLSHVTCFPGLAVHAKPTCNKEVAFVACWPGRRDRTRRVAAKSHACVDSESTGLSFSLTQIYLHNR